MDDNSKIYTRKGDKGMTSLLGGTKVPKSHLRIESYGTVDELVSFLGLLRDQPIDPLLKHNLVLIQERLFTIEAHLAADPAKEKPGLPEISQGDIDFLESEMDQMNEQLPALHSFILPGGEAAASMAHVSRCICRRAERLTVRLSEQSPVDDIIIRYLNRLSDYLFVAARKILHDNKGLETPWKPAD